MLVCCLQLLVAAPAPSADVRIRVQADGTAGGFPRLWACSAEQYWKPYDNSADAVKRALPAARIGGPHSTGPGNARATPPPPSPASTSWPHSTA